MIALISYIKILIKQSLNPFLHLIISDTNCESSKTERTSDSKEPNNKIYKKKKKKRAPVPVPLQKMAKKQPIKTKLNHTGPKHKLRQLPEQAGGNGETTQLNLRPSNLHINNYPSDHSCSPTSAAEWGGEGGGEGPEGVKGNGERNIGGWRRRGRTRGEGVYAKLEIKFGNYQGCFARLYDKRIRFDFNPMMLCLQRGRKPLSALSLGQPEAL